MVAKAAVLVALAATVVDVDMDTAPSFLRFAAIQGIERKQGLANLAPEGRFISAEAVERVVGQIGEAQKATREFGGRIDGRVDRRRFRAKRGFVCLRCDAGTRSKLTGSPHPNSA